MKKDITIRYSRQSDFPALVPMLDRVFGFPSDRTQGFLDLLPKLYNPEMTQLIAEKDGEPVGAVGIFTRRLIVGDEILTSAGIGNVACVKEMRGEGIMTALMERATRDIIASGAELSDLGGRRHRYAHFGYECAGKVHNFSVRADFTAHTGAASRPLSCAPIEEYLSLAERMYNSRPVRFVRDDFDLVTRSWCADSFALLDKDEFFGYAIVDDGRVAEMCLCDPARLGDAVTALIKATEDDGLELSMHETDPLFKYAIPIYDGVRIRTNEQISVLNFKKTAFAYAKIAAKMKKLPDVSIPMSIEGIAGKETFTLAVTGGDVTVTDGATDPTVLSHHEAIAFLFGLVSLDRASVPNADAILPLPIYVPSPDAV